MSELFHQIESNPELKLVETTLKELMAHRGELEIQFKGIQFDNWPVDARERYLQLESSIKVVKASDTGQRWHQAYVDAREK